MELTIAAKLAALRRIGSSWGQTMIALLVLATNAGDAYALHWSSFEGRFDCPEIENAQECSRFLESRLDSGYIRRINSFRLDVILLNGKVRSFLDERIGYSAIEVDTSKRFVVLYRQFDEGGAFSLLDRNTGLVVDVGGYPVFSPDRKWLVEANADLDAGWSANVLKIYEVHDGELTVAFDAKAGDWGPEAVKWDSSGRLLYTYATFECFYEEKSPCENRAVTLSKNKWK